METSPNKLNEFNHAEDPARRLLEQLGWVYVPAEHVGGRARQLNARCCWGSGCGRPCCASTTG